MTSPEETASSSYHVEELFHRHRNEDTITKLFSFFYTPVGFIIFFIRCFLGCQTFVVACMLRKSAALRMHALRMMCSILGIVVEKTGKRDESARVLCANHVSILDHLAIDILTPCLLPSVWDIPAVIRWCFGYVDLGATRGRNALVDGAKELIAKEKMPLLAFPEGVITSGEKALLKFNTWCFEVSSVVQPVAVRVWRPYPWKVSVSVLGTSWWTDLFYFFSLPFTVISVEYLPKMEQRENESLEDFTGRVADVVAKNLKIHVSRFGIADVAEAVKRMRTDSEQAKKTVVVKEKPAVRLVDPRQLDECAMRIKQSFPTYHLAAIRKDLEKTRSQTSTVNNLKAGKIALSDADGFIPKVTVDASGWREVFETRKWQLIEKNRKKYMTRDA